MRRIEMSGRFVGDGEPCFIVAEIGINHNGDLGLALRLIDAAVSAGCDAVKFQKRTPELCVPPHQQTQQRDTPWGRMTYLEYRDRLEFGLDEYRTIDAHCRESGVLWFASCWDEPSVEFMGRFDPPSYKIPSATLTDDSLLKHVRDAAKPILLSTGMSTLDEVQHAVELVGADDLVLLHCTSTYPSVPEELNLAVIPEFRRRFVCPVGYSGHEVGLSTTLCAVVLGACVVERHVTIDRAMWGTDQAASVEPYGLTRLVRDIRGYELALGDGIKRLYDSELPFRDKLRRVQ